MGFFKTEEEWQAIRLKEFNKEWIEHLSKAMKNGSPHFELEYTYPTKGKNTITIIRSVTEEEMTQFRNGDLILDYEGNLKPIQK